MLWRKWSDAPLCMFCGLNPSTATESINDPTVTRCIKYAHSWGYGGLLMTNLFAFRATDPQVMKAAPDPIGPDNDLYLRNTAKKAGLVVAAWGNHGAFQGRSNEVVRMFKGAGVELMCLKMTGQGEPGHPLYLPKNLQPISLSTLPTK